MRSRRAREIYQYKQHYALQALIFVGVSTLAELVVSSASPFNIVDQLQIPYFTFAEVQELIQQYVSETRYHEYVQCRGFHAFDTKHLREGAWHYSLDGFINFFIQQLGGDTLVEVPSGRGRTDILILYKGRKCIIETKIFLSQTQVEHGKQQLADYCRSENIPEGFYVVFTQKHQSNDTLFFDETVSGKRIRTYLIRTNFEAPSTRPLEKGEGVTR